MALKMARAALVAALIVGCGGAVHAAPPRPAGTTRLALQRHDLSIKGWEVLQARVDLAPGASFPRHKHPGEEIIYVLEGSIEYEIEGEPPATLRTGDVLFVPKGMVHSARNAGTVNAAELGTYVVERGKPLVVLVK
jgi:quercetin dioxygenase-like cupin family protein